jgi:hypothetical protein
MESHRAQVPGNRDTPKVEWALIPGAKLANRGESEMITSPLYALDDCTRNVFFRSVWIGEAAAATSDLFLDGKLAVPKLLIHSLLRYASQNRVFPGMRSDLKPHVLQLPDLVPREKTKDFLIAFVGFRSLDFAKPI